MEKSRALAREAADVVDAALSAEQFSSLPPQMLEEWKAAATIARTAADPGTPDDQVVSLVEQALAQLGDRPGLPPFKNARQIRAAEQARMLLDRARRAT